jgi:hypothetical protein
LNQTRSRRFWRLAKVRTIERERLLARTTAHPADIVRVTAHPVRAQHAIQPLGNVLRLTRLISALTLAGVLGIQQHHQMRLKIPVPIWHWVKISFQWRHGDVLSRIPCFLCALT